MTIIPVILSGGSGTRLWPLSVPSCPKQFLPLAGEKTMIQETVLRLSGLENTSEPIVICGEAHRFIVAEQLSSVCQGKPSIILEPCAKNTAPAIAQGAWEALKKDKDAVMVVLPSDHVIRDTDAFRKAVSVAAEEALKGSLVTFGIVPTQPHTGYGYIKAGESSDGTIFELKQFVEKPDLETAKKYLAEGTYSWNSGMFVFKAQSYLDQLKEFEPQMAELAEKAFNSAERDSDFIRVNGEFFSQIQGNSIDYAVMEKTKLGKVMKLDAGWDDVGSWQALWEINAKDDDGNSVKNTCRTILLDAKNNYVNAKKNVAVIGADDLVIVESDDAILVAKRDRSQDVKKAAEFFKE